MARKNNLLLRKKDHQFLVQDEMQRRKQRMEKLERVQELKQKREEAKKEEMEVTDEKKEVVMQEKKVIRKIKLSRSAKHKQKKDKKLSKMEDY